MSIATKCLINNALLLTLATVVGVLGHPWIALLPLIGISWPAERKSP